MHGKWPKWVFQSPFDNFGPLFPPFQRGTWNLKHRDIGCRNLLRDAFFHGTIRFLIYSIDVIPGSASGHFPHTPKAKVGDDPRQTCGPERTHRQSWQMLRSIMINPFGMVQSNKWNGENTLNWMNLCAVYLQNCMRYHCRASQDQNIFKWASTLCSYATNNKTSVFSGMDNIGQTKISKKTQAKTI